MKSAPTAFDLHENRGVQVVSVAVTPSGQVLYHGDPALRSVLRGVEAQLKGAVAQYSQ